MITTQHETAAVLWDDRPRSSSLSGLPTDEGRHPTTLQLVLADSVSRRDQFVAYSCGGIKPFHPALHLQAIEVSRTDWH